MLLRSRLSRLIINWQKWHPDLHSGQEKIQAQEKIKKINEANEVLSDPEEAGKV